MVRRWGLVAAAAILISGLGSGVAVAAPPVTGGDTFVPLAPQRLLDTRTSGGPLAAGGFAAIAFKGVVPTEATAVVLNVTAVGATAATSILLSQDQLPAAVQPSRATILTVGAGRTRAGQVTVALAEPRGVTLNDQRVVLLTNAAGSVNVLADLAGYYVPTGGAGFTPVGPVRVLDTRNGTGDGGSTAPVGPGGTLTLDLSARVPATATAVTFNLTATGDPVATFIEAYPGTARPTVSNLNVAARATTPNLVTVPLGPNRTVTLFNEAGSVHLVADLAGYYAVGSGAAFYPVAQFSAVDMEHDRDIPATLPWNASEAFELGSWLPDTATAAMLDLTGVSLGSPGTTLTAYADGAAVPLASNVNLSAGQTASNSAVVPLSTSVKFDVHNASGTVALIADVEGYFAPTIPACTSGCVQSWGDNASGQAGDGTFGLPQTTPSAVPGLSSVVAVTGRVNEEYALTSDGTVWTWGSVFGLGEPPLPQPPLGAALLPSRSVPARVPGLGDVVALAPGVVVRADGTVWTFGGTGPPVQVPGLSDVTAVADGVTSLALKADGTVWVWQGLAGNGSATPVTAATEVPGLTGVTAIASDQTAYALKSDGTVWAWGDDNDGAVGDGTATTACGRRLPTTGCQVLSPVQVGGLTGVVSIAAGPATAYAVRADGSAVAWGDNQAGEILGGSRDTVPAVGTPRLLPGVTGAVRVAASLQDGVFLTSTGTVLVQGALEDSISGGAPFREPAQVPGITGATGLGTDEHHLFALTPTP